MKFQLNGLTKEISNSITIEELLESLKLRLEAIAVAQNDEVIPHSEFRKTWLSPEDRIEIIQAVGGG